jgi:hypothetical protein
MQIIDSHRSRDLSRSKFRSESQRERTTGPKDSLRVNRAGVPRDPRIVVYRVVRESEIDARIINRNPKQTPERGRNEQVALDMPQAPDEDLEPILLGCSIRNFVILRVVVPVEHDQSPQPDPSPPALAKIGQSTCRAAAAQDHSALCDAASQAGLSTTGPALEDFAISRALDIEDEIAAFSTTG